MDNPYGPPSARVADAGPARGAKPAAVYRAIRLLWLSFAIDLLSLAPAVRPDLWETREVPLALSIAFTAVFTAIDVALIVATSRGRNWARWVMATFFVLTWLTTLLSLSEFLAQGALAVALDGVTLALDLYAFVLLFSAPSNAWFKLPE
jgi:hypothetical protein